MLEYIIPISLIVISILIILFLISKKFSEIASLNTESLSEEKESRVKNRILISRLQSNLKAVLKLIKPLKKIVKNYFHSLQAKLAEIEKKNKQENRPLKFIDAKREARDLLGEARDAVEAQDFKKSEKVYIEIIDIDPKNLDAYEGLVSAYRQLHDYKKARETCRYYLKLLNQKGGGDNKHRLARCYADLGEVYELENKAVQALNSFKRAVDLEPSNPRFLDLLLKISILLENKVLAWETFNRLKQANPDNQKLAELKQVIDELS